MLHYSHLLVLQVSPQHRSPWADRKMLSTVLSVPSVIKNIAEEVWMNMAKSMSPWRLKIVSTGCAPQWKGETTSQLFFPPSDISLKLAGFALHLTKKSQGRLCAVNRDQCKRTGLHAHMDHEHQNHHTALPWDMPLIWDLKAFSAVGVKPGNFPDLEW